MPFVHQWILDVLLLCTITLHLLVKFYGGRTSSLLGKNNGGVLLNLVELSSNKFSGHFT